ncbi:phage tail protein [Cohnella boryungensis]|uniref:Phage tail protein n=1 Tax=Cohnella boryungensis TaxID=768479 RepID=A0ABV8SK19_9BACL
MDPYVGEIRLFSGNYAPYGWALCDGTELPIMKNSALFGVIGFLYGGDGKTTFKLPNLNGMAPMHQGTGPGLTPRMVGKSGGESAVTLTEGQMPVHTHIPQGTKTTAGGGEHPTNAVWASESAIGKKPYGTPPNVAMHPQALSVQGGNQPHNNMQPYLPLTFIIAMEGVFPVKSS